MEGNDSKRGALNAAIVCLVLGCIFMFMSLWSVIFYAPLFLASFILSIVAMAQKNTFGGVMVLLSTMILPLLIFGVMFSLGLSDAAKELEEAAFVDPNIFTEEEGYLDYSDQIEVSDFEARYYTDYLDREKPGVRFKLKNNGDSTLSRIKLTVYFKDFQNNIIHEEDFVPFNTSSIVSDDKPLRPDYIWQMESSKFYQAENVPDEWEEGNADIEITDITFN